MKVLHINWSGKFGGAEEFAYNLAVQQGDATIAYMSKKLALGDRADREGIRTVEFNMRSGFDALNFKKYISFIKRERFDVIHDHNGGPLVRLSKIFSKESVFIQHIHGTKFGEERWERLRVLFWKRITNWLVDHYVANSEHTKTVLASKEGIPLARVSVVYNGIDIDKFTGVGLDAGHRVREKLDIKRDEWVVGIVGNLTPAKGIDKFICVAKQMDFGRFVIVGDGELRGKLEEMVSALGLRDKVIFTGAREDIPEVLRVFDVFLLTSKWEAFGMVLIEAMGAGVPVVAFKVGGVAEVVCEGCGILIAPEVSEAVGGISYLRKNSDIAQKMSTQGIKCVKERFNISRIAKEIEEVYLSQIK